MEKYLNKAKVLNKFFAISGIGWFDLSTEETARIIELLCTKDNDQYLEANLQELYERLEKIRLG